MRAVRAAIVMPGLFAFTYAVIGNLQMATFAAFGSFATLVLAAFGGTRREKLIAHAVLAVAGSLLLTIGTAVSSSTVLAVVVTVPVTFLVFFAGVAGPNAASGVFAALLVYVLPAASPGTISMVPDRLVGWWLASVVGTAAVLAISPPAGSDRLREAASVLADCLATELEAMLAGQAGEAQLDACLDAKHELLAQFTATPFRPTGLATADEAMASSVELLEWCTALLTDTASERSDLSDAAPEDRELLAAAAAVLRDAGSLFGGGDAHPDLERLEDRRLGAIARTQQLNPDRADFRAQAQLGFHAHTIAITILAIGWDAQIAARLADSDDVAEHRRRVFVAGGPVLGVESRPAGVAKYTGLARRHATIRSVWFLNSSRGALALAAAVAVADLTSVQHGFWVVLGTLSVLRTNAASTGATALRALAGTAGGFAVGAILLLAIGSSAGVLWVTLPVAVLIAAYAPGTAPFAVGQAAFTVTVAILFNLLVPVGWSVGAVRIEDVAIGCVVSVVVGILFWPRGVSSVVGDDLADAYRYGASYLRQTVEWVGGLHTREPDGAMAAVSAGLRLDDALRGFVAEQGTKKMRREELWRLVGGSMRLRLTALAIAGLAPGNVPDTDGARAELGHRVAILDAWYDRLATQVGRPRGHGAETLVAPTFDGDLGSSSPSRHTIWLCEHLDHLTEHLQELVVPAANLAEIRRQPWWR
jgi:uncharacterized membrane protein YccC